MNCQQQIIIVMNNIQNQKQFFIREKHSYSNQPLQADLSNLTPKNQFQHQQNLPSYFMQQVKSPYPETRSIQKYPINPHNSIHMNHNNAHYQSTPFLNINQNIPMAKSYMKKQSVSDFELMIRDIREKIFKINRTLHDHEQQIHQIKQNKMSLSTNTSMAYQPKISSKILENLEKQQEESNKYNFLIQKEIEKVKTQLLQQLARKDQLDYRINMTANQLQARITDKIQRKFEQINDLKCKIPDIKKQHQQMISIINEANRTILGRIEKNIAQFKQNLETIKTEFIGMKIAIDQKQKINFITSNKMFYDPRIIKYKETVELLYSNKEKQSQLIMNQTIYYLDKQGYLLDKNFYYLLDKHNKPVQLDEKNLNFMKYHNILQG